MLECDGPREPPRAGASGGAAAVWLVILTGGLVTAVVLSGGSLAAWMLPAVLLDVFLAGLSLRSCRR